MCSIPWWFSHKSGENILWPHRPFALFQQWDTFFCKEAFVLQQQPQDEKTLRGTRFKKKMRWLTFPCLFIAHRWKMPFRWPQNSGNSGMTSFRLKAWDIKMMFSPTNLKKKRTLALFLTSSQLVKAQRSLTLLIKLCCWHRQLKVFNSDKNRSSGPTSDRQLNLRQNSRRA